MSVKKTLVQNWVRPDDGSVSGAGVIPTATVYVGDTERAPNPPWADLKLLRTQLGMTQAELADGVITQSMLCHIERGRIMPRSETLRALVEKVGEDGEIWIARWSTWRNRSRVREHLWVSLILDEADAIRRWLQQGGLSLTPFERIAFTALAAAIDQPLEEASAAVALSGLSVHVARYRGQRGRTLSSDTNTSAQPAATSGVSGPQQDDPYAGAWTQIDRARSLTAHARASWHLATRAGREVDAVYWKEQMAVHLRETVWGPEARGSRDGTGGQ